VMEDECESQTRSALIDLFHMFFSARRARPSAG
jgi:hypothetical protein